MAGEARTTEFPPEADRRAFPELIEPLAQEAEIALRAALAACGRISPAAILPAMEALRDRLSDIATPPLLASFRSEVPLPAVAQLYDEPPDFAPRERYLSFVNRHRRDLSAWPVLRDCLATVCVDFVQTIERFGRHLLADAGNLAEAISGWTEGPPPVTEILSGLSDPHAGGRSVIRVTFADGRRLAYKPRALAAEAAFGDLLAVLSGDDAVPRQYRPWVLDAGDHGWMEWIEPAPLATAQEAALYMARCGGLAAHLYLLRGGDIHPDNLIPAGAFPVIVDLECLFQPSPFDLGQNDPLDDPHLFSSGLLPVFTSFDGGATMVSIAAAGAGPVPLRPERCVRHAGTDWLHLASRPVASFATGARLGEAVLHVRDHADAFAHGFQATLTALWKRREVLLTPDGALSRFRTVPCRLLCAPTNLYALVLQGAFAADAAHDAKAFAANLQRAGGRPPQIRSQPVWQEVLRAEVDAMARLDVPAFLFRPEELTCASVEGAPLGPIFRQPMYERAEQTLNSLDASAIADTTVLLRASLRPAPAMVMGAPSLPQPNRLSALKHLAEEVVALAVPQGPEAVAWVRLWEQMPAFVAPAGHGLCYGAGGTAVFLAEAGRTLDDDALLATARRALQPLRAIIRRGDAAHLAERVGPGWGRGIGGMIAALSWCARLLDDPAMAGDARALADAAAQALHAANTVDVMDGAAGLAFGLATLPLRDTRLPLRVCGRAILDGSRRDGQGRNWPDHRGACLTGLSHGASGMAAALAYAHAATGEPEWLEAALEACSSEDRLFDPQTGRWHGGGAGSATHRPSSWCHGAPGLALVRAMIANMDDTAAKRLEQSAARTLATARTTPVTDVDDLCCGEAGRLEALSCLDHGDDTSTGPLIDMALDARLHDWAHGHARLLASRAPGGPGDAALFRGIAGLGHLLVRRTTPSFACDVLLPHPFGQ